MAARLRKSSRWEVEIESFRRQLFTSAYHACGMNTTKTAKFLGINRTYAVKLLGHYGLPRRHQHVGNWGDNESSTPVARG